MALALAAAVAFERGWTAREASGETIRQALKRLEVGWKRAEHFAVVLAAHRAQRPPYGTEEATRRHDHLLELGRRALDGVPACSAAKFTGLAAWLAAHGGSLPTVNGWKKDLDLGDGITTTLSGLTWRVARGATADGSGEVAETIRRLKARHEDGPLPAEPPAGRRTATTPGWVPSVVYDEGEGLQ